MKKFIYIAASISAALALFSCTREMTSQAEEDIIVISATIEDDATKTSLSGNDTEGYDVVWTKGDSFKIGNATFTLSEGAGTKSGKFTCSATQLKKLQNGTFTVYYPSTYDGTWPAAQNYNEDGLFTNYPMKASVTVSDLQVPESITFKNEGGILRLTVDATDLAEPVIVNSVTVSAAELYESISLYSGDGVTIDEGVAKDFYIAVPAGEYTGTTITFNTLDGKVFKKSMKAGKSLVVERSAITTAKFSVNDYTEPFPNGTLPGVFSVSDSKKVVFSRGNMYWNGSSFQFEGSQLMYDDQWNGSHVSHFFWTPKAEKAYAEEVDDEFFDEMLPEDVFFTNADGFTANGESDTWFTMSNEEWEYLLGRDGKCSFATVAGRKGWVIAPDNYSGTLNEKYDAAEWPSAEVAGLVFLPFAGQRMTADEMGDFETQGCYWSASLFLEDDEDASCADYYGFTPEDIFPDNTWRESGYAIRLVKEYSVPTATTGTATAAINGVDTDVTWIQLWDNGPKFAEYNVGTTSEKKYGAYFAWAKNIASTEWGDNWRMPTDAEFQALLDNCTFSSEERNGVKGYVVTGKQGTAYALNSVFFPAGSGDGFGGLNDSGWYWSSSPISSERAWLLSFTISQSYRLVDGDYCTSCYTVRAVLAE